MSVSTGANTLQPEAISAETFASLRSMSPMGKLAIPSISLTLVTQCLNSHTIGKWTTSPSMRKIGRNGYHPKKMRRRKNKTPKTKNPRCLHIIIYVRILDFCFFATNSLIIGGMQTLRPFPLLPLFAHYSQMMQIAPCPSHPFSHLIPKLQHPHSVAPSFPKTLRLFSAWE